jgi:eukaryotic-like serine/threonine-protein kinase
VLLGRGRFVIHRKLGAGGMGVVYEAIDRESGTAVALKTLRQASPTGVARFKREFRALADVIHPNLVSLYELFADENEIFFTMELVQGAPFSHFVRPTVEGAPLEPSESLHFTAREPGAGFPRAHHSSEERTEQLDHRSVATAPETPRSLVGQAPPRSVDLPRLRLALRQLAEGVAAIHDAGMLHRDLKPSNVLVTQSGRVVILDFGLVSMLADEGRAGDDRPLEGTVAFMSPEQAARVPLSPASDWYGVGAMLYHALTGKPPFTGDRVDMIMAKVQHDPPPPLALNPDAPLDLDELAMKLLHRDPTRRPGASEILRALGSAAQPRSHFSLASTPAPGESMVGRERQLAELGDALVATRAGAPVLAHVRGPSGMGKSRLLRAFAEEAGALGALVLQGRCYERESMPFKALDSLIDALARHLVGVPALELEGVVPRDSMALARLFPVLRQIEAFTSSRRRAVVAPNPQELRRRAFAALRELCARLADRQPLIVSIDDVQWGDADSAQLLASLLRPPDAPAALFLLGHRAEDAADSEFLRELEGAASAAVDVREVELGPLAPEEARRLARAHLTRVELDDERLERLVQESQGIPFFVEELARAAREESESSAPGTPEMGGLLRARMARLLEPAARLLSIIAVAGRPVAQDLVMRAAEVDDPAMLQVLKAATLVRTRLVAGIRLVECYHDRVRETAAAQLTPAEVRERHHRLAVVYEASPTPDPEALAQHLAGAGDALRAAEFAVIAAQRAAQALAFERAAQLYRLALSLDPAQGQTVRAALGEALANAGRGAEAADALLQAAEGAPPAERLDLRGRAAAQLLFAGHMDRGLALLEDILEHIGMHMATTPERALLSLAWQRSKLKLHGLGFKERHESELPATQLKKVDVTFAVAEALGTADPIRAADFHARHLRLALDAGEVRRVMRALTGEAGFLSARGIPVARKVDALCQRIDEMAARLGDPSSLGLATGTRGLCAINMGRFGQASTYLARAEQILRDQCTGHRWEIATAQIFGLFAAVLLGRVREVIQRLPVLLEEAGARGDLYTATTLQAALGFYVPLARDDPEAAYQAIDEALARWSATGFTLQHANGLNSLAYVDLYRGDAARAHARVREAWPKLKRSLLLRVEVMRSLMLSLLGRTTLAEGARSGAARLVDEADRIGARLAREPAAHCVGNGLALRACCAIVRGERARALPLLADAAAALERGELRLNLVMLRRAHGQLVGGAEGEAMVAEADAFMRGEGLAAPERIVRMFMPTGVEEGSSK